MTTSGDVEVWRAWISEFGESDEALLSEFSAREKDRAVRHLDAVRARSYLVTQSFLRRVLAHYTRSRPGDIAFEYGSRGKPRLSGQRSDGGALHFNMSHSADLVGVAVTSRGEVGLDIEKARRVDNPDRIARRFFSPAERNAIEEASMDDRDLVFVQAWTRYEARVKKVGGNMWGRGAASDTGIVTRDVAIAPGYGCSVASDAGEWRVSVRDASGLWTP